MKTTILTAVTLCSVLTGLCANAYSTSSDERSVRSLADVGKIPGRYGATLVRVSHLSGYFVVVPGSDAITSLGLQDAPYRDSDNISRSGVGLDVIAFRFGPDGKLEGYPMYISQENPEQFYTRRLEGLTLEHTTLAEVKALFGDNSIHVEKQGSRTLAYLEVPVYDPLASGS